MKARRNERAKEIAASAVIALFVAALVFSAFSFVVDRTRSDDLSLTSRDKFLITSTVSSSSSRQIPAMLDPGVTRYLWYTVHNSLRVPVTVTSLGIKSVSAPRRCAASNLDVSRSWFHGALVVPAKSGHKPGKNRVAVPIKLRSVAADQSGCKHVTFKFHFSGRARYTQVYATATAIESAPNPSEIGQPVTYTATVTGAAGANQDPLPASPTGTVTFTDGSTAICSDIPVTSTGLTTSSATCTPSAYQTAGSHSITAVFSNTDDNFEGSTSPELTQVVRTEVAATATAVLGVAPSPSIAGRPVMLTARVAEPSGTTVPTGTARFYRTTSSTATLLGTGALDASGTARLITSSLPSGTSRIYAVYGGDSHYAASTSPSINHLVVALPKRCAGSYNLIVGNPSSPRIKGTAGNDFIYAPGRTNWTIRGGKGKDCIHAGDGNNTITDRKGAGVIVAGNGRNTIVLGSSSHNVVKLGNGKNTIRIQTPGHHNTIKVGKGTNTAFLGGGKSNTFVGAKRGNTCHLPSLPARAYRDTLVNCRAVTP